MKTIRKILWISGIIVIACTLAIFFHLSTTTAEYSSYNIQWNGTSVFMNSLGTPEPAEVHDLHELEDRNNSVLFIIAPVTPFQKEEIAAYRAYLENGNVIILADDSGSGNDLLEGLSSPVRIHAQYIGSIDRMFDDPSSVIVFPGAPDVLNEGIDQVVMNRPVYLEGGQPVYTSSLFSWADLNGNGRIDQDEELSRYVTISRVSYGTGSLYVISDPSIFINAMQDPSVGEGNRDLILRMRTMKSEVLVDQVHGQTGSAGEMIRVINLMKSTMLIRIGIFFALMLLCAGLFIIGRERVT